jgi:DNA-binding CsgD family transcriptional regulator
MEHLVVLFDIVTLVVGTWVAFYTYQSYRSTKIPYLRSIFFYIIFYNLTVSVHFLINYTKTNLMRHDMSVANPWIVTSIYVMGFVTQIGLTYSLVRVVQELRGRGEARLVRLLFVPGIILFAIGYWFGLASYLGSGSSRWIAVAYTVLVVTTVGVMVVSLLIAAVGGQGIARFLLFGYLLLVASYFLPDAISGYVLSLTLLWLNLVPYLWISRYVVSQNEPLNVPESLSLDNLVHDHGISKREREIMELILQGKSNQEIEALLFISFSTVKNHVYNLFQKLGVKSRGQMVHLVLEHQKRLTRVERSRPQDTTPHL